MQKQHGFSLMEILIALVIIGILGALVLGNFGGEITKARFTKIKADFQTFENALERYRNDNGFYPTSEQGLQALESRPETDPEPNNYPRGGYLKMQKDPWGREYLYLSPAEYGDGEFEIISLGADGQEGGEGERADVTNWNLDEVIEARKEAEKQ